MNQLVNHEVATEDYLVPGPPQPRRKVMVCKRPCELSGTQARVLRVVEKESIHTVFYLVGDPTNGARYNRPALPEGFGDS